MIWAIKLGVDAVTGTGWELAERKSEAGPARCKTTLKGRDVGGAAGKNRRTRVPKNFSQCTVGV